MTLCLSRKWSRQNPERICWEQRNFNVYWQSICRSPNSHEPVNQKHYQSEQKLISYLMTWTWAMISRTSSTRKPSWIFDSSINFFHPQSCSFFQNLCSVSAKLFSQLLKLAVFLRRKITSVQLTWIFNFLWIKIAHSYSKLGKMAPSWNHQDHD